MECFICYNIDLGSTFIRSSNTQAKLQLHSESDHTSLVFSKAGTFTCLIDFHLSVQVPHVLFFYSGVHFGVSPKSIWQSRLQFGHRHQKCGRHKTGALDNHHHSTIPICSCLFVRCQLPNTSLVIELLTGRPHAYKAFFILASAHEWCVWTLVSRP